MKTKGLDKIETKLICALLDSPDMSLSIEEVESRFCDTTENKKDINNFLRFLRATKIIAEDESSGLLKLIFRR